jgi:hypothetical protein
MFGRKIVQISNVTIINPLINNGVVKCFDFRFVVIIIKKERGTHQNRC